MSAFASSGHTAANAYRRFVPIADLSSCSKTRVLFDHLVGCNEQRLGHSETEHSGSLRIDDQFELAGLHHRKVRGLGAFENLACIDTDLTIGVSNVTSVAYQPAVFAIFPSGVERGQPVIRSLLNELDSTAVEDRIVG